MSQGQEEVKVPGVAIQVHIKGGTVFECRADDQVRGRSQLQYIATAGYLHNDNKVMEYYPPSSILKVVMVGGMRTAYPDKVVT